MDIEQSALAGLGGAAALAIVQSVWVALGLVRAGSGVKPRFCLQRRIAGSAPKQPSMRFSHWALHHEADQAWSTMPV